ncbi:MAG: hypothetical protein WAK55_17550 [Xanthobacteraceae bacterium]
MSPICGQPEETCLALLAQPLKRRNDVIKYLSDTERFSAAGFSNRVVQMEEINPIAA